jgi:hypothetical protein
MRYVFRLVSLPYTMRFAVFETFASPIAPMPPMVSTPMIVAEVLTGDGGQEFP